VVWAKLTSFCLTPNELNRVELAVELGQKQAGVPRSFNYKLEQRFLILEVILNREQPLHAAIDGAVTVLFVESGNAKASEAARLKTFNLCLP